MTVKEIIDNYGIKQEYLRKKMGVSKGMISHYLNKNMTDSADKRMRHILKDMAIEVLNNV